MEAMKQLIEFALQHTELHFHLRRSCYYSTVYASHLWLRTGLIYLLIQASEMCENEN